MPYYAHKKLATLKRKKKLTYTLLTTAKNYSQKIEWKKDAFGQLTPNVSNKPHNINVEKRAVRIDVYQSDCIWNANDLEEKWTFINDKGQIHCDTGPAITINHLYFNFNDESENERWFLNGKEFIDRDEWMKNLPQEKLTEYLFNIK